MLRPVLHRWAATGATAALALGTWAATGTAQGAAQAAVQRAAVRSAQSVAQRASQRVTQGDTQHVAQGAPPTRSTGLSYAASDAATPAGRSAAKGTPGSRPAGGPAASPTGGPVRGAPAALNGAVHGVVRGVSVDTAAASASITRRTAARREVTIDREVFQYDDGGRRDPFVSLLGTSELRPMISDLRLAVVVYDPRGNSRAVLRDISQGPNGKPQSQYYSVRVGQTLGRMRVAAIGAKSVTFTILEFGESRQETLALNDSTKARTP